MARRPPYFDEFLASMGAPGPSGGLGGWQPPGQWPGPPPGPGVRPPPHPHAHAQPHYPPYHQGQAAQGGHFGPAPFPAQAPGFDTRLPHHRGPSQNQRGPYDRGPAHEGTEEWLHVQERANMCKEEGNKAIKEKRLGDAVVFYSAALDIAYEIPDNFRQLAMILSNRSHAHLKLGRLVEALEDARESIEMDSTWHKGYIREAQVYKQQNNVSEALAALRQGFLSAEMNMNEQADILQEMAALATRWRGGLEFLEDLNTSPGLWGKAIAYLQKKPEPPWYTLKLLFLGTDLNPGVVSKADCSQMGPVHRVLEESSARDLSSWVQKLLIMLLQQGLQYRHLGSDQDKSAPLKSALLIAIKAGGNSDLLKHLFKNYAKTKELRSVQDKDGNTLLHIACERQFPKDQKQVLIQFLLNNDVDFLVKNRSGKLAQDYLSSDVKVPQFEELAMKDTVELFRRKKSTADKLLSRNLPKEALVVCDELLSWLKTHGEVVESGEVSNREVAEVYLQRSQANLKLKNTEGALKDVKRCLRTDIEWYKGHQQMGNTFNFLEESRNAIEAFKAAYDCALKEPSCKDDFKRDLLMDVVLPIKFISDMRQADKVLADCSAPAFIWFQVVKALFSREEWRCVYLLVNSAVTRHCKFNSLDYTSLLKLPGALWKKYGELIILKLLERGGQLAYLAPPVAGGSTPLHGAVIFALEKGSTRLLETLLKTYFTSEEKANQGDYEGKTVLHLYAQYAVKYRNSDEVLDVLMASESLNWLVKDSFGAQPIHYVRPPRHPIANRIRAKMDETAKKAAAEERKQKMKKAQSRETTAKTEKAGPTEDKQTNQGNSCQGCRDKLSQADQLSRQGNLNPACEALCTVLTTNHDEIAHHLLQTQALQKIINIYFKGRIEAVPTKVLKLPGRFLRSIVTAAFHQRRWHHLSGLLSQYRSRVMGDDYKWSGLALPCLAVAKYCSGKGKGGKLKDVVEDLACEIDVAEYIQADFSNNAPQQRYSLLELLLLFKAPPDGSASKCPITAAIDKPDFRAIRTLLYFGAPPTKLSLERGDTPLHAAARIGLEKDTGNFESLETLFEIAKQFRKDHPELCSSVCDVKGNTVFHLAAKVNYSKHALKLVEILSRNDVNPNLRNADDKTALQCIPRNKREDRRAQYIKMAAKNFPYVAATPAASRRGPHLSLQIPAPEGVDMKDWENNDTGGKVAGVEPAEGAGDGAGKSPIAMISQKEVCRQNISELIELLGEVGSDATATATAHIQDVSAADTRGDEALASHPVSSPQAEDTAAVPATEAQPQPGPAAAEKTTEKLPDAKEEEEEEEDEVGVGAIEAGVFDDLEWEVDCTAEVWKVLKDNKVPFELKQRSIRKIQLLATGEWLNSLCKPLVGVPSDIELYEAKLSKGSRIIWELTVDFSPRRSETAERRLCLDTDEPHAAKGGRIYSEIIRVWDIVLDHNYIHRSIGKIIKSHKRGQGCIIQKKLHCSDKDNFQSGNYVRKRLPRVYTESEDDPNKQELKHYFPPASSNETEYHIMKFYSFGSALVQNVLQNQDIKVDFPFRVTELEHAIINLQPKPPCPILLLGRSGTGKTTCCLYRLWTGFVRYWEKAEKAEDPLLPRSVTFAHQDLPAAATADRRKASQEFDEGPEKESDADDDEETSSSADDTESIESCGSESSEGPIYDHLHQVFVTKNAVLCSEVQKNFRELSHACAAAKRHVDVEEQSLPNRFQDAHPDAYPFFLTSRQFLLMLDASIPPPFFFDRKDDFSLKREVKGWMEGDGPLTSIPEIIGSLDEEAEEEDADADVDIGAAAAMGQLQEPQVKHDPRTEVTYELFAFELWPKMQKKVKLDCHPTLVWVEIMSFIEGSVEALNTSHGFLSCDEYKKLGRKRAPNFSGDRDAIYEMFKYYRHLKSQRSLFDEGDVIFNLYQRMKKLEGVEWVIHQFFVDETQDFTQAELCLLLQCCQNPNDMFLTGDTAQSIMRGISFRFEDLKSLFFYAQRSMKALGKTAAVEVPKRLYQLTHNYRSHAGILRLASSVVDLMVKFFPESFDRLKKDQGLFEGPQPILLESCSFSDLALLLRGNQRETSHIEFGAHQAILVANDATRDNLPEELSIGLVLTIFESKGLEFDDILLYNFFKDSQAQKEWRVVTDHLQSLLDGQNNGPDNRESVVELDKEFLEGGIQSRPLKFDPDRHKVLNSELKHLYTALTRARVNVWIFDEDSTARAPMFEYFKARRLVHVLGPEDTSSEEGLTDKIFAERSSPQEWQKRGDEFYRHSLYKVAAKCYRKSGDEKKEKMSKAQQHALDASQLRHNPRRLREEFLYAAEEFLDCGLAVEAVKCLNNAREFLLVAKLYEKMGKYQHAAVVFRKLGKIEEACHAFEDGLNYSQAVELLVNNDLFDKAIDAVERYHIRLKKCEDSGHPVPRKLLVNAPGKETRSVKRLSLMAAKFHCGNKHPKAMLAALDRLPDPKDRINFLLERGMMESAAPIMRAEGRGSEIAQKYYETGKLEEALKYADADEETDLRGRCLLALARQKLAHFTGLKSPKTPRVLGPTLSPFHPSPDNTMARSPDGMTSPQVQTSAGMSPQLSSPSQVTASPQTATVPISPSGDSPHTGALSSPTALSPLPGEYVQRQASDLSNRQGSPDVTDAKGQISFAQAVSKSSVCSPAAANHANEEIHPVTRDQHTTRVQTETAPDFKMTDPDNPEIAKAKKYLQEAILLFGGRNAFGSGEAKLLLGGLKKDPGLLRDACSHFKDHDAGFIECIDVLGLINRRMFTEDHANKSIEALGRILKLLAILNSQRSGLKDQEQMRLLYGFYGLEQTTPGRVQVTQESARILDSFRKQNIAHDTDEQTARSVLEDILLIKANGWVQCINKALRSEIRKNQQCPSYVVGKKCRQPNCPMLHKPHVRPTYGSLLRSVLAMMKLNCYIEKSLTESKGRLREGLRTITTHDPWKWCDELYNIMYPRHAHPFVVASNDTIPKLVLQDIRCPPVKRFVLKYVERKWSEADSVTRQANTDFLLKIHTLLCLIGEGPQRLQDLLLEEDRTCTIQAKESPEAFQRAFQKKIGFWIHGKSYQDVVCYTYMGNFHMAVRNLHSKNPIEGLARMCQFFGFIVKRHRNPLIPSFANTARLLEIMTVWVAGFHLCHHQKAVAILPASYLAAVFCWNAELQDVYGMNFYLAIKQGLLENAGSVNGRAHYLVKIMCGQVSRYFDVIGEAFSEDSAQYLETGEAERVLVLALVLLINSGGTMAFPQRSQELLHRAIANIQKSKALDEFPRVATAVNWVKSARSRHNMIAALMALLDTRDKEYLNQCTWRWDPNGVKGIYYEPITSKSLKRIPDESYFSQPQSSKSFSSLEDKSTAGAARESTGISNEEADFEEDISSGGGSSQEMEKAKRDQEEQNKRVEKIIVIQRATRAYLERRKQDKLSKEEAPPPTDGLIWETPKWELYKVESERCWICGMVFEIDNPSSAAGVSKKEEDWLNTSEDNVVQRPEATDPTDESKNSVEAVRAGHIASQTHVENESLLKVYKKLYEKDVLPVIQDIDKYLRDVKKADNISESLNMEMGRLNKACEEVFRAMKSVQDNQNWGNTKEVHELLWELQRCYDDVSRKIEVIQEEEQQRAHQDSEIQEALGDDHDVLTADVEHLDDEAGHIQEVAQKPRSRRERKNKQKTRKKK